MPVAQAGFPQGKAEALDPAWMDPGEGPEPHVLHDVQSAARPKGLRKQALGWGCRSILAAPMWAGERRIGVLVITSAEAESFPPEEVLLWKNLSTSLGVMLSLAPARPAEGT